MFQSNAFLIAWSLDLAFASVRIFEKRLLEIIVVVIIVVVIVVLSVGVIFLTRFSLRPFSSFLNCFFRNWFLDRALGVDDLYRFFKSQYNVGHLCLEPKKKGNGLRVCVCVCACVRVCAMEIFLTW